MARSLERAGDRQGYDPADRDDHRLATRPVVAGRGGAWNRTTLTWKSLNHQTHRLSLDPAHQRWFAEFAALHRATRTVHLGQDPDWIHLDEYESPLLWQLLAQAEGLRIPLLAPEKGTVALGSSAAVSLRAASSGGALELRPVLRLDDGEPPVESARPIARHGVYAVVSGDPSALVLAPTPRPLDDEELRLLRHPEPALVPQGDVDEFLRDHLPALRERVAVRSADSGPDLDEPEPPRLVCTVSFEPRRVVRVGWHWRRTPIAPPSSTEAGRSISRPRSSAARDPCWPRRDPRWSPAPSGPPCCAGRTPRCSWSSSSRSSKRSAVCGSSARACRPTTDC
ncbi:hypothetical protein Q0F99_17260 [Rathayibacter oskolensis]|uniref:hypothetical protein n=1 Tax=Rathayibacter oskolensis TaxID=1891671 RepID=UPI00265E5DD0|nr:hypothetical protein [Rathayibacter oskolensis]WKK71224.1 hypothetical protein Q0F99_17260 [Rathayibacter oskolensis]